MTQPAKKKIDMKYCNRCKKEKELSSFHKDVTREGGLQKWCFECVRLYQKSDKYRAYRRKYQKTAEAYKEHHRVGQKNYIKNFPQKQKARLEVRKAILKGNLVKGDCEICGNIPTHAHHQDYSKPLDVTWLCIKHHEEVHHAIET